MTQTALIEALKVGPHTISRLYNNTFKRVDADTVEKICEYFDCDLTDLFELKGESGNGKRFAD